MHLVPLTPRSTARLAANRLGKTATAVFLFKFADLGEVDVTDIKKMGTEVPISE